MPASIIHKRVTKDSKKSNYNWIASATDLIEVCKNKNFPIEYANDIKIAILNCFSKVINEPVDYLTKDTDFDAVCFAYNSLYELQEENKDVFDARANFLYSFIRLVMPQTCYHYGTSYIEFCKNFRTSKFIEYIAKEEIDFNELKNVLKEDFLKNMRIEEEKGAFTEDDKKYNDKNMKLIRALYDFRNNFDEIKPVNRVKVERIVRN